MSVEATDTGSGEMTVDSPGREGEAPPIGIFISYRREESRWSSALIHDHLASHFGKKTVFRDVDTIEPGMRWPVAIRKAIASCDLVLVVIGQQWLEILRRRSDDPQDAQDWHRFELETAIKQDKAMFALLVDGAAMPRADQLPESLKLFAEYQSFIIGQPFKHHIAGVIDGIEAVARRIAAEREQIATEQAATEAAEREQAEREEREKAGREQAEREQAAARAERDRIAAERAAAAKASKARAAGDKAAERERIAADRERAEREEREKAEREKAEREEREKAEREKAEREKAEREKAEREEREKAEREQVRPPSLREAVDQAGLKYQVLPDGTLAFPFRSERAAELLILARALSDEIVLFSVRLPKPGMFGQEAGLRNLLRASFQANYTKVMASASLDLMAASELHPSMLTPGVVEGLIRGLASLGDLRSGDLRDWQTMTAAIRGSRGTQENHIVVDPDAAREAIRRMAEEDGLAVQESAGVIVFEFPLLGLEGSHLKLLVNASSQVISIGAFLGMKPQGNKVQFMQQLLQLNQVADVARVGLDADDEVAFLYEVPVVTPGLLEEVKTQFMLLSVGVAAIAAGDLRRRG